VINRYTELAKRIRRECVEIDRIVTVTQRHWHKSKTADDMDAYLNSVALNLHGFYSGLERLFELIAVELDRNPPSGEQWHIALLRQMTLDVPTTRPPVLQIEIVSKLDAYRKFRHLIRNIYTTNIVPGELEKLIIPLPQLWAQIKNQLDTFADYLNELARADEDKG